MFELHTLLTALELDESTDRTLETAANLASHADGVRHFICHAVDPISPVYERLLFPFACFGDDREALLTDLLGRAEALVSEQIRGNRDALGSHTLRLTYGHPAEAVLREAQSIGPDVVVVGATRGAAAAQGRLGREASEIAARATVPVLVVRRQAGDVAFNRIGAALDFSEDSTHVLEQSIAFAHLVGGALKAVHVVPHGEHLDHAGYVDKKAFRVDQQLRKLADQNFKKVAANMKLNFPLRHDIEETLRGAVLEEGDPGPRLVASAREEGLDLIVLQKSRDNLGSGLKLGRVAEYVARHAPCDVLLLPPPQRRPSVD